MLPELLKVTCACSAWVAPDFESHKPAASLDDKVDLAAVLPPRVYAVPGNAGVEEIRSHCTFDETDPETAVALASSNMYPNSAAVRAISSTLSFGKKNLRR